MTEKTRLEQRIEKFNIIDPETGELVLDKVAEKRDYVERGVNILSEIATLEEDLNALLDEAKEDGYSKPALKKLIQQQFNYTIDEKVAELEAIKVELNNLFGE